MDQLGHFTPDHVSSTYQSKTKFDKRGLFEILWKMSHEVSQVAEVKRGDKRGDHCTERNHTYS